MGVILTLAGAALMIGGLFVLYGPWTLVGGGAALVVAALTVDWERLS